MAPPGFGAMVPAGGGGGMAGGGPKGEVRNPVTLLLISLICSPYLLYWLYFLVLNELKAFLGKSDAEINPMKELLLTIVTCGIYGIFTMLKLGKWMQEAQQRAGRGNAEDKGVIFLIDMIVFAPALPFLVQTELNKVWDPSLS